MEGGPGATAEAKHRRLRRRRECKKENGIGVASPTKFRFLQGRDHREVGWMGIRTAKAVWLNMVALGDGVRGTTPTDSEVGE